MQAGQRSNGGSIMSDCYFYLRASDKAVRKFHFSEAELSHKFESDKVIIKGTLIKQELIIKRWWEFWK